MQGFPWLVAGCGAQRGSRGLWGGSHRVRGAHEASPVVLAFVATDWWDRVQSPPSPPDGALELLWL